MKKVGILTMHYAINYGAVLQCYAFRKKINSFSGVRAEVLNVNPLNMKLPEYSDAEINNKFYNIKLPKFNDFVRDAIGITERPYFEVSEEVYKKYNYFIVGSDQIWNPDFVLQDCYFLDFAPESSIKIAYAPSVGKSDDLFSVTDIEMFRKYIPRFDYLSVREHEHTQFIQRFTDKKVVTVLDPTLLLTADDYDEMIVPPPDKDKYIFLYFVNDNSSATRILSFANSVSLKYGLKVKHSFTKLPSKIINNEAESFRLEGPKEFLGLLKNAEMVITNSFHATAFSVIFEKTFYSFIYKNRGTRVLNLLDILGLNDRLIKGYMPYNDISFDMDFLKAREKLTELKSESVAFLKKALDIIEDEGEKQ